MPTQRLDRTEVCSAPIPAVQRLGARSRERTLRSPQVNCVASSVALEIRRLGVWYCVKPLASGGSIIASRDDTPTQALQLPRVAEQGEQTHDNDKALED